MKAEKTALEQAIYFLEEEFLSLLLTWLAAELKQKITVSYAATNCFAELDNAFREYQRVGDKSDRLNINFEKLIFKLEAKIGNDFKSTEFLAKTYFDLYRQWMKSISKKQSRESNTYEDKESPIRKAADYIDSKVLAALLLSELAKQIADCIQSNKRLLKRLEAIKGYHAGFKQNQPKAFLQELKPKLDSSRAFISDMVRQDFNYASSMTEIYFNLYLAWLDDFEEKQLPQPLPMPEVPKEEKPEVKKEKKKKPKLRKTEIIRDEAYYSGMIGASRPEELKSEIMIK